MITPCDTNEEDADEDDKSPEEARDSLEGTSELLNGKSGGVDGDAVHTNYDGHG